MSDLAVIRSNLDSIREIDARGVESWSARSLSPLLGYSRFEKFMPVLERTQEDLAMQGYLTDTHIHRTVQMIEAGNGAERDIGDWKLSRLACYLTCMNARTPEGSLARQYFAFQARRAEMADQQQAQATGHPDLSFYERAMGIVSQAHEKTGEAGGLLMLQHILGGTPKRSENKHKPSPALKIRSEEHTPGPGRGRPAVRIPEAMEWMRQALAGGPRRMSSILDEGTEQRGYSKDTMFKAADRLGLIKFEEGSRKWWALPAEVG